MNTIPTKAQMIIAWNLTKASKDSIANVEASAAEVERSLMLNETLPMEQPFCYGQCSMIHVLQHVPKCHHVQISRLVISEALSETRSSRSYPVRRLGHRLMMKSAQSMED